MFRPHSFWAINMQPGVAQYIPPSQNDLQVTLASLRQEDGASYRPTSVNILPVSKPPDYRVLTARGGFTFCTLTPGRVEQVQLKLWLPANQGFVVECIGPNGISLLGCFAECRENSAAGEARTGEAVSVPLSLPKATSRKRPRQDSPVDDVAGSNDALEQSVLAPSSQQSIGRPNVAQQRPRTRDPPPATDPMTGINFNEMQVQAPQRNVQSDVKGLDAMKTEQARGQGTLLGTTMSSNALVPVLKPLTLHTDVLVKVVSQGDGDVCVELKDIVKIVCEAWVLPSRKQFVSNPTKTPFRLHIGYSGSFTDIQAALLGKKAGSMITVILPSHRAYGPRGQPELQVPPHSQLQFDIHVFEIEKNASPERMVATDSA